MSDRVPQPTSSRTPRRTRWQANEVICHAARTQPTIKAHVCAPCAHTELYIANKTRSVKALSLPWKEKQQYAEGSCANDLERASHEEEAFRNDLTRAQTATKISSNFTPMPGRSGSMRTGFASTPIPSYSVPFITISIRNDSSGWTGLSSLRSALQR